jgi:DNA-damage-inducible protein J
MQNEEIIMTGSTMTNLSIRIDRSVKAEAEALFAELGLNMSTAINLFVRQSLRQRRIPFEIAAGGKKHPVTGFIVPPGEENDPFWSDANQRALRKAIEEREQGKFVVKTMEELEAMEK